MHTLTFYPLGNADTYLLSLGGGQMLLFDYADMRNPDDQKDLRIDLPTALRQALGDATAIDVVAFTHSDDDHVHGASTFFAFQHAKKYQGNDRIDIKELWVPAAFIIDTMESEDARVIRQEARHRLREGKGIRVFGRPDALSDWLEQENLTVAERQSCLSDAGTFVPGFTTAKQGVSFFAHSPFAEHQDQVIIDKNQNCLVLQATFEVDGGLTYMMLGADATCDILCEIVQVTKAHNNEDRLLWDIFKIPHHSSYLSLNSSEKGTHTTSPAPDVKWLFEQGQTGGILISTSQPIPTNDDDQPPHRQAANYYRGRADKIEGKYIVTMEHPSKARPEPLVITVGKSGPKIEQKRATSADYITSRPSPRFG